MMSLWDALRMNMMISYQELVRTFPKTVAYCLQLFIINITSHAFTSRNSGKAEI